MTINRASHPRPIDARGREGPRSVWGPFTPNLDWAERKARLRSLRTCVGLQLGPRGRECAYRLLAAEIAGDDEETLKAASAEFDRLAPLDRRHVLASFSHINFDRQER